MKRNYYLIATMLLITVRTFGQGFFEEVTYKGAFGAEDWTNSWSNWDPAGTKYPGDEGYIAPTGLPANPEKVEISGNINPGEGQEVVWTNDKYYEISGPVNVLSGTLRIQEGTVVRGKVTEDNSAKAYVLIAKGAKIYAVGTPESPIVFTSSQAPTMDGEVQRARGDWGGLLLIGKGLTNTPGSSRQYEALPNVSEAIYGGGATPDDNDSSGVLKYVRIEFAGNNPSGLSNSEINGLTFAAVGKRTHADYIQVSFSQDDAFEWFGGTSSHHHLIAFASTDDDFDGDEGYRGKIQFALSVKHPAVFELAGTAASNGLELDNNTSLGGASQVVPGNNNPTPVTNITFSNITLVGPILPGATNGDLNTQAQTRFGSAALIRTNNSSSIFNSIITGYNTALVNLAHPSVDILPSVQLKADQDSITIKNTVFGHSTGSSKFVTSNSPVSGWSIKSWIIAGPTSGVVEATANDTAATAIDFKSGAYTGAANGSVSEISFAEVDYSLATGSPYLSGASFSHPKLVNNLVTGINDALETNLYIVASPNPFSENTTISYSLKNSSDVNISVFDVRGNIVAELAKDRMAAGEKSIGFNANGFPKGFYVIKAVTGSTVKTLKLVVQ